MTTLQTMHSKKMYSRLVFYLEERLMPNPGPSPLQPNPDPSFCVHLPGSSFDNAYLPLMLTSTNHDPQT